MTDPFDQLRLADDPGEPDPRFVAGLRNRLVTALGVPSDSSSERTARLGTDDLPSIILPDRSPMTDIAATTTTTTTVTLTPYICVSPAPAAIDWYTAVLGAVEQTRYTGDDGRIGHAELTIGGATLMLSDEYPDFGPGVVSPTTLGGTPFALHLEVPDVDAVFERVVASGDARIGRSPHDEAYGARSFDMIDPFGHRWMIQTPIANPSIEEINAASDGFTVTAPAVAPAEPTPVELGYLTFALPDTTAASRFYSALFGWSAEVGNAGDEYRHVNNTELPMGVTPGPADEAPVLYFRVSDIGTYAARVRELGGTVISEDAYESGPNAVCRDDQGREFQLWQPAPGYE